MADEEGLDLLHKQMGFSGCKRSLLCDDKLLTILRRYSNHSLAQNVGAAGGLRGQRRAPFECVQESLKLGLKLKKNGYSRLRLSRNA